MPLNILPLVLGQVTDAWSSVKRIEEFLREEEQEPEAPIQTDADYAVDISHGSFTWEKTSNKDNPDGKDLKAKGKKGANTQTEKKTPATTNAEARPGSSGDDSSSTVVDEQEAFKLEDINFQVGRSELIAVIGSVGSGKSSLLAALAGDMRKTEGELVFGASKAFCPQYAWIQNATLQKNILFGKDMDKAWYKAVIKA